MRLRSTFGFGGADLCRGYRRGLRSVHPVKISLVAGTSLLALSLSAPRASATPTYFYATGPDPNGPFGSIQTYTVPTTGLYDILATGAPGSNNGYGAQIGGDFTLTQGETLEILVGKPGRSGSVIGSNYGATGGGGGTFVVAPGNIPLVIAGGGGGAGGNPNLSGGGSASLGPDGGAGSNGSGGIAGAGGANGSGGSGGNGTTGGGGGGGGGFLTIGGNGRFNGSLFQGGEGGGNFAGAVAGPGNGGFGAGGESGSGGNGGNGGGGGGGTGNLHAAGGGGGGGYSGGGGGTNGGGGGGGGSFDSGTNQFLAIDTYADSGSVVITPLATPVPEPASLALFGVGLAGLLATRRRKR